jgi:predicted outer membrane repeat protein
MFFCTSRFRWWKNACGSLILFWGLTSRIALGASALVHVPADQPTLQDAIAAVTDGGVIEMAAGTYTAPSGGFTILDYSKGFTIRAAAGAAVTLSGSGSTDIIRFANSVGQVAHTITFDRLKFSDGLSVQNYIGGAMTIVRNNAVFTSCVFQNSVANPSISGGGAIWFESASASFQQCTFTNNNSLNYGGAIAMTTSSTFFRECTFRGNRTNLHNHAQNSAGGAIFNSDSWIRVDNCRFEDNHCGLAGGAIYCGGHWKDPLSTPTVLLIVNNSLFTANSAVRDPATPFVSASVGGAIHIEDQTTGQFSNSRFLNNFAQQGGAISSYRTDTQVDRCVFQGNHADGTQIGESLGGSIVALSADNSDSSTNFGTINRRSAILTVRDTLFGGDGVSKNALQGGAIFASGDLHAAYGLQGVTQNGTPETNRATVSLTRVGFADLVTTNLGSIPGSAGAIGAAFTKLTMDGSIIENCTTTDLGGGLEFVQASIATIQNSIIASCRAGSLGGALAMFGGTLDLHDSSMVENKSTSSGQGGALGTAPAAASGDGVPDMNFDGLIQNCVLSNNTGGPTSWEGDRINTPFNRIGYGNNQFFSPGLPAFFSQVSGNLTVDQLNNLVLTRTDGTQDHKGFGNTAPTSAPIVGALLMIPPTVLQAGAPGETIPIPSNLVFASSGGSVSLDGVGQTTGSGVVPTSTDGAHTLTVGGTAFNTPSSPPAFAANISTRLPVGTDQNVLIGGFIIQGSTPKRVIIRGIGPSLNGSVAGALQDPTLELHDGTGAVIATNDNWRTTQLGGGITSDQSIEIIATSIAPVSEAEPAIVMTLNPGAYTAIVRGAGNTTGIAVVEVYDLDPIQSSTLANIATRGFIQTGDNVMIGGFIYLGGAGATKVVVRGIGPSLSAAGITNPLSDPTLELHDGNGTTIASNDDWRSSPDASAIQAAGLQPTSDAESAIYKTGLPRGPYTAIVRGKNSGAGVGVVEAYIFQ